VKVGRGSAGELGINARTVIMRNPAHQQWAGGQARREMRGESYNEEKIIQREGPRNIIV